MRRDLTRPGTDRTAFAAAGAGTWVGASLFARRGQSPISYLVREADP